MEDKLRKARLNKSRKFTVKTYDDDKVLKKVNESLDLIEKVLADRDRLIEEFIKNTKEFLEANKQIDNSEKIINAINDIELSPNITIEKDEIKIPSPVVKIVNTDLYEIFKPSDSIYNENTNINYHGFLDREGRWFILREIDGDKSSYRYATSDDNKISYIEAIKNPQKLDYIYYNEVKL